MSARKLSKANPGEPILDILHLSFLQEDPEQIMNRFEEKWGVRAQAVVLPICHQDGLLFEVEALGEPLSPFALTPRGTSFQEVVTEFAALGLDIYLSISSGLRFCRIDALHVQDIGGQGSNALCVYNPKSQEYLATIMLKGIVVALEAIEAAISSTGEGVGVLRGIVFDGAELWPMGARNQQLDLTCFCPSCRSYFNDKYPKLLNEFYKFPNPLNLALEATDTGISHIDNISVNSQARDILRLSIQRGFFDIFDEQSEQVMIRQAKYLLDYVRLRHVQTVESLTAIFDLAMSELPNGYGLKRIITTEGNLYDWTSGLLLEQLDNEAGFDEVWFDSTSPEIYLNVTAFRSYMWRRGRYYLDAFLNFAASVSNELISETTSLGRHSLEERRQILDKRMRQVLATATERSALLALPALKSDEAGSQRVGFVSVLLDEDLAQSFADQHAPVDVSAHTLQVGKRNNSQSKKQSAKAASGKLRSTDDI